ncbi:MAG: GNAT family N-acetyltransferase [Planctomycetes bacterium]|nr:GNAT family N-acetyltransferase [Planctomycetota bacterium]
MPRLRLAQPADAVTLFAAERETARVPGLLVSHPHEFRLEAFREKIAELNGRHRGPIGGPRGRYLVACEGRRILGHAFLEAMGLESIAHVYRLTIVVHPGERGRGVGRALMKGLLSWARRTPSVGKVELLVRATNRPAIALYRSLGFVVEGRFRRRVRLPDGGHLDDLTMAWFPHDAE